MSTETAVKTSPIAHVAPRRRGNPAWTKGVSGNPRGRPAAGASYTEWLNTLTDVAHKRGGDDYLNKLADDNTEPVPKRQAALEILGTMNRQYSKSGQPLMANHRDAICDRTVGKPSQHVTIEATVQTLDEAEGDLIAIFRADPNLLGRILSRLTEQLPGLRESILAELGEPAVLALPAPTGE